MTEQQTSAQTQSSEPKKKSNVGKWIAIGCLVIVVVGILIAAAAGYWIFNKAKDVANDVKQEIENGDIQNTILNTVQETVENETEGKVNEAVDSLKQGTILSETGSGDESFDGVNVTTEDGIYVTVSLIAQENTDASLTITDEATNKVVAEVDFGTGDSEKVSTASKQLDIDPGTYTFEVQTESVAQWTVVAFAQ